MLDRIALDFANLPLNHYSEAILALSTTEESSGEREADYNQLVPVLSKILNTMRAGGRVRIGSPTVQVTKEAIIAGFLVETDSNTTILVKPASTAAVPLRLKRTHTQPKTRKRLDFLTFDTSDTIDESSLLESQDFTKPIIQPLECAPAPGKRRKACKDCTCGLKELDEAADTKLRTLPIVALGDDEFDFTVQGKSSCGSCGLGDAFRCSGCPFIGMPAFKPGEEVTLLREAARWADDL